MDKREKEFIEKYDMQPIVDVMDKALDKLNHITKCLLRRKDWMSYAVYRNGIHILETRSLKRAIDLFISL